MVLNVLTKQEFAVAVGMGIIFGIILSGALTPHIYVNPSVTSIKPVSTPEPVYVTVEPTTQLNIVPTEIQPTVYTIVSSSEGDGSENSQYASGMSIIGICIILFGLSMIARTTLQAIKK